VELSDPAFWLALLQIIGVNIILSGDNALVIALACRRLPKRQQRMGIVLGAGAAVALRVVFTVMIVWLLGVPWLKLAGGVLLLWIGWKLMQPQHGDEDVDAGTHLWDAVRIIVIADAVMSLDNVIAVAAAAKGDLVLLVIGLVISVPLVVYGATLLMKLIERFPPIVVLGAALIGYIGGEVAVTDPVLEPWVVVNARWLAWSAPTLCTLAVVLVGRLTGGVPPVEGAGAALGGTLVGAAAAFLWRVLGRVLVVAAVLIAARLGVGDPTQLPWAEALLHLLEPLAPILVATVATAIIELAAPSGKPTAAQRPATEHTVAKAPGQSTERS
jgi:YjbE family integral membrane protein